MASPNENSTPPERGIISDYPSQQHTSGIIIPPWWRHKYVLPVVASALISIAFSIYLLSGTQQRVENKKPEYFIKQEDVVDLRGKLTLFPDPNEVSTLSANRAYEEALPQDLYEHSPVVVSTSSIAKVNTDIGTRYVVPEEIIPQETVFQETIPQVDNSRTNNTPEETYLELDQVITPDQDASDDSLSTEQITSDTDIASLNVQEPGNLQKPGGKPAREIWQQFILPFDIPPSTPLITIIIDDMGIDQRRSRRATTLPGPLTLSYLTYANDIVNQTSDARRAGHELMLHIPMQPGSDTIDPGPNALTTSISSDEILKRLRWGMSRFEGFVGINNHMGSRFTQNKEAMRVVLNEIKNQGYLFLDSRTSGRSVAAEIAAETGITFASRNVFLDHVDDRETVRQQLAQTERLALRNGSAIAIGHPRDATLDVLKEWLPTLAEKGIVLAPLSAIVIRTHQSANN